MLLTSSAVIFPLFTFPFVTRVLSNASLGKFFFIDSITQYFIIISAVGIPYYGIREIAKLKNDQPARSKLVVELLVIQVTLGIISSIVLIALHYFIPSLKNEFNLVKVACLAIISTSFLMEWFYQGMENYSYITSRSLIIKTLSVVTIFLLVKSANDYLIYYLITTAVVLFNAALNFINYIRKYHVAYHEELKIKQHIKSLLILSSINISVSIYAVLDTIILGLLTNPENVSYYSVPLKAVKIYWTVINGAGMVLIPRIASYFVNDDLAGIQLIMQKSISIVFLLSIPFCFFCIMFPEEILKILSGSKYIYSANALRILSVVPFIIAICNVCGSQFLMAIGQEKHILHATILGLVLSLVFNFLLIPYLKFFGAAITCVIAESVVCIYITVSAWRRIKLLIDYALLKLILLSILIAATTTFLIRSSLHGILLIASIFFVYCFSFIFLQFIYFKNSFVNSLVNFQKKQNNSL
jgi:O-antigen/teichoic acid export membrane protein